MALTPDGTKNDPTDPQSMNDSWIQADMFPNLQKYARDEDKSAFLDDYMLEACASVNEYCQRKFNKQVIDQIELNRGLGVTDYNVFVVRNRPLISVDNVWLNIGATFSSVGLDNLQIDTNAGVVKILPSVITQLSSNSIGAFKSVNLWLRYTSGFNVDYSDDDNAENDVPRDIRRATAMYVDYLYGMDGLRNQVGVKSYKTQTYAQTNASASEDPILDRIGKILDRYKTSAVFATN